MKTQTALYGKPSAASTFDLQNFTKGFIAGLVTRDLVAVRPQHPADRRGFADVVKVLDEKIGELEKVDSDKRVIRQLMHIANELRQSTTGGFEGFEAALRSLQLTLSSCPNPFYEEITFPVPKRYAEATVRSLPEFERTLVNEAAEAFAGAVRRNGG